MIRQTAEALEELGIDGAAEAGELVAGYFSEEEAGAYLPDGLTGEEAAAYILSEVGCGWWDADTWAWSPTSDQVYWLDQEVFNLDTMYTDALRGIAAITAEDVIFDIGAEDTSAVDREAGAGTQSLSFACNGVPCRYDAEVQGDWLDLGFLSYVGEVLDEAETETERRLYLSSDNGQGCILLWQTPEWARSLRDAVGLELTPAADGLRFSLSDLL